MKLSERLQAINGEFTPTEATAAEEPEIFRSGPDPLADFKSKAKQALYGKLEARTIDATMGEAELRAAVVHELERFLAETETPLSAPERERIAA